MTPSARISKAMQAGHKAVSRMVGLTLMLGGGRDLEPYWGLAVVLRAKLTRSERQGLAWAALMACDDDEAAGIADAVLHGSGMPASAYDLEHTAQEAEFWAAAASRHELRAYALACLDRLSPKERAALLRAAGKAAA